MDAELPFLTQGDERGDLVDGVHRVGDHVALTDLYPKCLLDKTDQVHRPERIDITVVEEVHIVSEVGIARGYRVSLDDVIA
jgi:hypothetical protein